MAYGFCTRTPHVGDAASSTATRASNASARCLGQTQDPPPKAQVWGCGGMGPGAALSGALQWAQRVASQCAQQPQVGQPGLRTRNVDLTNQGPVPGHRGTGIAHCKCVCTFHDNILLALPLPWVSGTGLLLLTPTHARQPPPAAHVTPTTKPATPTPPPLQTPPSLLALETRNAITQPPGWA